MRGRDGLFSLKSKITKYRGLKKKSGTLPKNFEITKKRNGSFFFITCSRIFIVPVRSPKISKLLKNATVHFF